MKTLQTKTPNKRAFLLLFIAFAIAYAAPNYTQYQFSPLGAQIMAQFSLDGVQFNSIFTAPMIPAVFTSVICGLLVDRYGYKPVIAFSMVLTVIGAWLRVFANGYGMMFLAMLLVGFSAGFLSSNASKILSQLFGPEKVSLIMGFALSISTLGLVLSMSTTTLMGSMTTAFTVAAVICTIALVLWVIIMPSIKPGKNSPSADAPAAEEPPALGEALKLVLKNRYVWFTGVAMFCINGAMAGTGSMVPTALTEVRGIDPTAAGVVGAFMMVGNLLGSLFTPTITMKTGKFRLVLMICGAISAVGCAFAWLAPSGPLLYLAMIATGYAFGSGMSQLLAVAVRLPGVGPKFAGTAGGLIATLQLLGGVILPAHIASAIAGTSYSTYFIIIGLSSLLWILAIFLLPKELDVKG